jgi:hypothetical protein
MSEEYDREELDELLETVVAETFDAVILRAQQRDESARTFLANYKEYYLAKGKRAEELLASHELCKRTAKYIDETLAQDPQILRAAGNRWSTGLAVLGVIGAPILAAMHDFWYAGAVLVGAGISYIARRNIRTGSKDDAKMLQLAIPAAPYTLKPYIQDSRDYMGQELWEYGALSYEDLQARHDERTRRKHHKRGKHARQHAKPQPPQQP